MSSNLANERMPGSIRGFTMIEIIVVLGILVLVAGAYFYTFKQQGRLSANDQEIAAYYMEAAIFMDAFYADTRMARRIEPTADGCIMEIRKGGGLEQVSYTLRGDSIERLAGGKTKIYSFGKPLRPNARTLFRVRELAP